MSLGYKLRLDIGLNLSTALKSRLYKQHKHRKYQSPGWVSRLHQPSTIMEQHLIDLNYLEL